MTIPPVSISTLVDAAAEPIGHERFATLAAISRGLGEAPSAETALAAVLDVVVPNVATHAMIQLLDSAGSVTLSVSRPLGAGQSGAGDDARSISPPKSALPAAGSHFVTTRSLVAAIATEGGGRAVLALGRDAQDPPFETADLACVDAIGAALVLALRAVNHAAALERAAALAEATRALIDAGPNAEAVLTVVARQAAHHVGDLTVVRLLSADGRWLEPAAVDHPDPAVRAKAATVLARERHPADEGVNGTAMCTVRAQRLSGEAVSQEQQAGHPHLWSLPADRPTTSLLAAPLRAEGRAIGALSLSRTNGVDYSEDDERFVQELADRAGLAIERARLFSGLRASEERLRLAQYAGNVGVWDWDAATGQTYWSETMWTLYGLDERTATPGNDVWLPRLHPDDRPRVEAAMATLLTSDETEYHDEFRIVRPSGEERWIEVIARVTRDAAGQPLRMSGVNLDVTEHKRTEAALRASEERLRLAIEANRMVAWEWDPAADRITTSENFADIYGLPALAGAEEGFALVWPDDLPAHQENVSRVAREGGEYQSRFRITRPSDGQTVWLEERATALTGDDGRIARLVGVVTDITAAKAAEVALAAANERFNRAEEAARAFTYEWDLTTDRIARSAGLFAALGYHPEELAPTWEAWNAITHPDDRRRDKAEALARIAERTADAPHREYRVRHKDGSYRWLLERSTPIRNSRGEPVRAVGQAIDITERKAIADTLAERESFVTAVVNAAPRLVYVYDLATNRNVYVNDQLEPLLGWTREDLDRLGDGFLFQLAHPDDVPAIVQQAARCVTLADGEVIELEYRLRHKNGEWRWVRSRDTVFSRDPAGNVARVLGLADDITEQKNAAVALQESAYRMRIASEAGRIGFHDYDIVGNSIVWDETLRAMWGVEPDESITYETFVAGLHPEDRAATEDAIARALDPSGDGAFRHEYRVIRRGSGEVCWIAATGQAFFADGRAVRLIGTAQDVSERTRQQAAMRLLADAGAVLALTVEAEARLERVARVAIPALADSVAIYLVGDEDRTRRIALAHTDPAKEALLRELERYVPGADHPRSLVGQVLRTGEPVLIPDIDPARVASILPQEPRVRELVQALATRSVMIVPMVARGIVIGAMVFNGEAARGPFSQRDLALAQDLAGRVAAAVDNARLYRQARDAEARIGRLFDTGVIGLLVADNEQVTEANDRFLAMVGYSRADLEAGRLRWPEMTPPEYAALDRRAIAEIAERGFCTPFEKEYFHRDGSRIPILIGAAAIRGTSPPWICAILDLSIQKAGEQERLAFLDTLAHDVKNPLGVIKGHAQLAHLRLRRGAGDATALEMSLAAIETGVGEATALIDELLDVARLRAGQPLELRLADVDLVTLAESGAAEARASAPGHIVRVESDIASLAGLWDEARLRRVLANLLGNAVKFSPHGGEVTVRLTREDDASGSWATMAIADQGVGIPARDLQRIFERFQRGGNVSSIAGTGIGLAGSKQIVEQHGGTITVQSVEGQGSTFTVRLPLL